MKRAITLLGLLACLLPGWAADINFSTNDEFKPDTAWPQDGDDDRVVIRRQARALADMRHLMTNGLTVTGITIDSVETSTNMSIGLVSALPDGMGTNAMLVTSGPGGANNSGPLAVLPLILNSTADGLNKWDGGTALLTAATNLLTAATNALETARAAIAENKAVSITNSFLKTVTIVPNIDDTELADGDSAASLFEIDCARVAGLGVRLESIQAVTASDISSTKPDFDIWIFDRSVTLGDLNAAFGVSDGDMAYCVGGPFRLRETYWEANGALNGVAFTNGISCDMKPNSGTVLYGAIRARKTIDLGDATNVIQLRFNVVPE